MRQPEAESTSNQRPGTGSPSLAARSARVAWELLRQDEKRRLLDYVEKAKAWEARKSPLDPACCKTNRHREAEPSGRVGLHRNQTTGRPAYRPCFFCRSISRNSTRRIFPEIVLGKLSTNSISRGYL